MHGILLLLSACVALSGCTRNNGDIGRWFGTWQLEEITVDGEVDADYGRNIFWKFQNDIICMVKVDSSDGMNRYEQVWGTWEERDNNLFLDFTYSDFENTSWNGYASNGLYVPFPVTRIPYGEISRLEIVSDNSKKLTLRYVGNSGMVCGYVLRKQ